MKRIFLSSFLSFFCVSVYANMPPGFYLGGEGGYGGINSGSALSNVYNSNGGSTKEGGWKNYRLYSGWTFNKYFGMEVGYSRFDDNEYSTPTSLSYQNVKAWDISGKGYLPLGKRFMLIGQLGVADEQASEKTSAAVGNLVAGTQERYALRPLIGLGIGANVTKQLTVDFSWIHIQGGDKATIQSNGGLDMGLPNTNMFTLGITFSDFFPTPTPWPSNTYKNKPEKIYSTPVVDKTYTYQG